jgi:hypothetical protein
MSKTFFLENEMGRCPYCEKEDKIMQGGANKDKDLVKITMYCFRCDRTWTEIYVFLDIEEEEKSNVKPRTNSGGDRTRG